MDVNNYSYEWVETLSHLEQIAKVLEQAEIIGFDLEADSMYHYFEKVCLIQVATENTSYVLDPLAVKDLSPLNPIFSNPRIRKVFHGADYDIRSLYRDFQIKVENLFDTQLACKFLGFKETGLEALLRSRFHVDLNKKFQRADWSERPLSPEMVEYAAMDGRYLISLARMLEKELNEKSRLSWVEEECRLMTQVRFTGPNHEPLYLRVKGASHLDPRSLAVLEALLQFREAQAKKMDRPPFKVIRNEALLELAQKKPLALEELEACKVLSQKQVDRYGTRMLQEIPRVLAIPDQDLPAYPREARRVLPPPLQKRIKALKTWRDMRANHLGMEPGVLLNNSLIHSVALKNPRSKKEMEEVPGLKKWLQDQFNQEILAVLTKGHV
ncbi:MAG: HRDC domain-containing protein [Deltaproteobacteria bacterium]|nr:HRDC domain-containing protein [Deltaproteobacteria bacterium]